MPPQPFTIIDQGQVTATHAVIDGERVRLSPAAVATALGWELKPQGLCKEGLCIPVGPQASDVNERGVDLALLAALLGRPLALDTAEAVACLGASAAERSQELTSLVAPNFTLPDLDGTPHSLSDYRGRKVLLVAYASW